MALKVIVTGQPRTGTSFLTNLLSVMAGFSLGPSNIFREKDYHNPNGYYEVGQIIEVEDRLLQKLGGTYHNIPNMKNKWYKGFDKTKQKIKNIIEENNIEIIKSPRGIIIGDIYKEIYPDAIWFYTSRNIKETYRSRWGNKISFCEWERICQEREKAWKNTKVAKNAWNVKYENFKKKFTDEWTWAALGLFVGGINIKFAEDKFIECISIWNPRKNNN